MTTAELNECLPRIIDDTDRVMTEEQFRLTDDQVDRLRQTQAEIEWIRQQCGENNPTADHLLLIEEHIEMVIESGTRRIPRTKDRKSVV